MNKSFFSPQEIAENYIEIGAKKARLAAPPLFVLAILAGAFIAFASEGSNAAIHTIESVGLGKALAGMLFSTGLMLVLVAGGELFTGNCLILISCIQGRASWRALFRNWFIVYLGNFVGSILLAWLIFQSGQLNFSSGMLGAFTIKTAAYKTGLTFTNAFVMGILCNWLVCLAAWMSFGAKDIAGKLLAIFFPIWLFITSGFEHSVANMYYIPAGIMAKSNPEWVKSAIALGSTPDKIEALNWSSFFMNNLFPVTLGNIVGGCLFVACAYWFSYLRENQKNSTNQV